MTVEFKVVRSLKHMPESDDTNRLPVMVEVTDEAVLVKFPRELGTEHERDREVWIEYCNGMPTVRMYAPEHDEPVTATIRNDDVEVEFRA